MPAAPTLRAVRADDCDLVWRLNNEPEARHQSLQRRDIPLPEHRAWFAARLADPACCMWIVEGEGAAIGVVRGDVQGATASISLALAPTQRGRGLGRLVIAAATRALLTLTPAHTVTATIRAGNEASLRAFAAAGYSAAGRSPSAEVSTLAYPAPPGDRADVVFRCDAGLAVGWGHAVRCLALASALRARGATSRFVMHAPSPAVVAALERAGHAVTCLATPADDEATAEALRASRASAFVLDSYRHDGAWLDHVAHEPARVVIDDLGDRVLRCDLVVNPAPYAATVDYAAWGVATILRGARFALLRREFTPALRPPPSRDPEAPRVLVTLGGSALASRALEYATAIDAQPRPLRLALMPGGEGDVADAARAFAARARHEVEVHADPRDMAALLTRTTLAVSAAGQTCFELAACGVPALLVVGADNQRANADAWHAAGACRLLGEVGRVTALAVAEAVVRALADSPWLAASAATAQAMVDGDGASRVADAIMDH